MGKGPLEASAIDLARHCRVGNTQPPHIYLSPHKKLHGRKNSGKAPRDALRQDCRRSGILFINRHHQDDRQARTASYSSGGHLKSLMHSERSHRIPHRRANKNMTRPQLRFDTCADSRESYPSEGGGCSHRGHG
jgi:hypothetical protein